MAFTRVAYHIHLLEREKRAPLTPKKQGISYFKLGTADSMDVNIMDDYTGEQ